MYVKSKYKHLTPVKWVGGYEGPQVFNTKNLTTKTFSDGNSVEFFEFVAARKVFDVDFFTNVHFFGGF